MWYNEFAEGSLIISDKIPLLTAALSRYANLNSGILYYGNAMNYGGVYEITNIVNGKRYVGSSVNIKRRWSQHRHRLNKGIHKNPHLQNSYNKHGKNAFIYRVIVYTEPEEGIRIENILLKSGAYKYNIGTNATKPWLGKERSEETKKKLSEALKGENSPRYGKKMPKSVIKKLSESRMGMKFSEEHKRKLSIARSKRVGEKSSFYGCNHTEETKKKISASRRVTFTEAELNKMLKLRREGYSYQKIANLLDSNFGTVRRRIISVQNNETYLSEL
jgi:group I intron endonuclease